MLDSQARVPLSVLKNTVLCHLLRSSSSCSSPLYLVQAWRNLFASEEGHHPALSLFQDCAEQLGHVIKKWVLCAICKQRKVLRQLDAQLPLKMLGSGHLCSPGSFQNISPSGSITSDLLVLIIEVLPGVSG